MRFRATHKLVVYLLVWTAFLSVALGGELPVWLTTAFVLAAAASWFVDPPSHAGEASEGWWTAGVLAVAALAVADGLRGGVWIDGAFAFLLALTISRLFNRRSNREYRHLVQLSFVMLLLGTLLNDGLSFAPCFLVYIVLLTWNLVFGHLRREMEENYLLKHSAAQRSERVEVDRILNSRRVVGSSFLGGTALVSLGVFFGAMAVFVLFPRIGLGFFLGAGRPVTLLAGFSETVQLGQHGVIKDNPAVVMRVKLAKRPATALRFRGAVFERYEAGSWRHGQGIGRSRALAPGRQVIGAGPSPWIEQDIFLEPLDSAILFAADRPVAIDVPERGPASAPLLMTVGAEGEIRARRFGAVRYRAFSALDPPAADRLRMAQGPLPDTVLAALQLPDDLPQSIRDLATRLSRGRTTVAERVEAVSDHLADYRYSLRLEHDVRRDPLEEFLFVTKSGHCEYFSTAMTVLLRAMGVPARNVNGFLGGEWNEIGDFLAIRQGDAHSWVEVFYPGVEWVTHDPTPPAGRLSLSSGGFSTLRQALDTLHHHWLRWVVDYNFEKQASAARALAAALRGKPLSPGILGWREAARTLARALGWTLAALVVGWVLLRLATRMSGRHLPRLAWRPRSVQPALRAYRRMLALLARDGLSKHAAETPREFADRLADHPGAEIVARVTETYYRIRFGGGPADALDLETLLADVARLRALTTTG